MKKALLWIPLMALALNAGAQQTKILTGEKHNEYGLVYTLPTTAFQIEVVAVKEIKVAGPFSKYSKIFTSDSKIIASDEVNWSIESVRVTPYGIPDEENRYLMQLKSGATTYICVADDGMLLAINKEAEVPSIDSIEITDIEGEPVTGKEYLQFVNEDFIAAQSSYKKAQLLAEEIMEIRDAKISLTRGTAETMPTDGRQLEIMLASLDKQEKALINAFTGSSWKERIVRTFNFIPESEGQEVVCRLNPKDGFVNSTSSNGDPLTVSIKITDEPQLPLDAKGEEKKIPKDAVIYCVPGAAQLTLSYKGRQLFRKEFMMSQFGMNFGLNPSIFTDKKEPSFAIFDPTTGALKELGSINDRK